MGFSSAGTLREAHALDDYYGFCRYDAGERTPKGMGYNPDDTKGTWENERTRRRRSAPAPDSWPHAGGDGALGY